MGDARALATAGLYFTSRSSVYLGPTTSSCAVLTIRAFGEPGSIQKRQLIDNLNNNQHLWKVNPHPFNMSRWRFSIGYVGKTSSKRHLNNQ